MLLVSVLILFRGHNEPGGGFIGGLIAAAAYILVAMAEGPQDLLKSLKVKPYQLMAIGLLLALLSTVPSLIADNGFLIGKWIEVSLMGSKIKLGTPLLFDVGVYFTVIGFILNVILHLMEVWKWK